MSRRLVTSVVTLTVAISTVTGTAGLANAAQPSYHPVAAVKPSSIVKSAQTATVPTATKQAVATNVTTASGGPAEYEYDATGRIVGAVQNGTDVASYTYDAAGNITNVARYAATQLSLLSVVPASARPGATLVLHGSGFSTTASAVTVNGVAATVSAAATTSLKITVPAGATTGPVKIAVGGVTAVGPTFTLAPVPPSISAVSPSSGAATTTVTINGAGFDPGLANDVVTFNGVRAQATAATATSLTVVVPTTASSGPLLVLTPAGQVTWSGDFTVPIAGIDPATIESARRVNVGAALTSLPVATAGKLALVLVDAPPSGRLDIGLTGSTFGGSVSYQVIGPFNDVVATNTYSTDDSFHLTGLTAGRTYQLVIDPGGTLTGQVGVTMSDPLSLGQLTSTGAGTAISITRAGQSAITALSGTAGQALTLGVTSNTFSKTTYVYVYRPDGTPLGSTYYISSTSNTVLDLGSMPTTGTYLVYLRPAYAATGALTLTSSNRVAAGALSLTGAGTTVTLGRPGQEAGATVAGTAGQALTIALTANTLTSYSYVYLYNPDGTQLGSSHYVSSASSAVIDVGTLTTTGTYTVVVQPQSAGTGTMTVTASTRVAAGALSLTGAGTTVTLGRPGQEAGASVAGTAGQVLSIGLTANTVSAYSYIYVYNPDGTQLGSSHYISSASSAVINVGRLATTGTYTMLVQPQAPGTGAMTLAASTRVAAGALSLTGVGTTVTLGRPGQEAGATVAGTAGQALSLAVTANTLSAYSYVYVYNPDGTQLGSSHYVSSASDSVVSVGVLPTTGTYNVLVQPQSAGTGTMTLTASTRIAAGALSLNGAGTTITLGRPAQDAGATVAGTAGQALTIGVTANTLSTYSYIYVYNPDGTQLGSSHYVGSASSAVVNVGTPATTGTYSVLIQPQSAGTGSMTLTASTRVAAGSMSLNGAGTTVTLGRPGQDAGAAIAGTAGQALSIAVSANTIAATTYVYVYNPDGTQLSYDYVSASSNGVLNFGALPATGTYTVVVLPQAVATGALTLTASTRVAAGALSLTGAGTTVTIARAGQEAGATLSGTAGQSLTIAVTGNTIAATTYVYVYQPDGTQLDYSYASASSNAVLSFGTLSATGTYTVVVQPQLAVTGALTLTASTATALGGISLTGAGTAVTLPRAGQSATGTLSGTAGQRLTVAVSANTSTTSTYVYVYKPDGTTLDYWSSSAGSNSVLNYGVMPVTGTYTVTVRPISIGSVSLTLTASTPAVAAALTTSPTTVSNVRLGQAVTTTFAGSAGQTASLNVSSDTISGYTDIYVFKPDGTALGSSSYVSGGSTRTMSLGALPVSGSYTIQFRPESPVTGSLVAAMSFTAAAAGITAAEPADAGQTNAAPADAAPASAAAVLSRLSSVAPDATSTSSWSPDRANLGGIDWQTRKPRPVVQSSLRAPLGVTAVTGVVLDTSDTPLPFVNVRMSGASAFTDSKGQFLLRGVSDKDKTLVVDGMTAGSRGKRYGLFRIRVTVRAGVTTELPATVWLPRLDTKHTQQLAVPSTKETVLTTPLIPGLEVHIPAGSVVRDENGKVVRELGITPIPIDRTPYPLPPNGIVPVFFTVQPGGTYVFPKGAQIVYPNYTHLPPGTQVDFENYDPEGKGWYVYGHGHVSANAKQVQPDATTKIWAFDGAMFNAGDVIPWLLSKFADFKNWLSGDPVDLSTGQLVDSRTDLAVEDSMPIELTRTLWQGDTTSREFGIGQIADYGMFLRSEKQYEQVDLYVPGGAKIHYVRTSAGTGYVDAVFAASDTSSAYEGSTISWDPNPGFSGWDLKLTDGTTYVFPMFSRVKAIRDRNGNQLTFTRTGGNNGDLTQITSPHGRWIKLGYDTAHRVTSAVDNIGRTVTYTYDTAGRLSTVTNPAGKLSKYTYDASGRVSTLTDARNIVYLTNVYDGNGRVSQQTLPDGLVYKFAYTLDTATPPRVTETRVTQPNGSVRRAVFDAAGAVTSDTAAYGTSLAPRTTYNRGTNHRVTSVVDPFGRTTAMSYDSSGHLTSSTVLSGTVDAATLGTVTYGAYDLPMSSKDPAGKVTNFAYDSHGNLLSVTDPMSRVSRSTYNSEGQVVTTTDTAGKVSIYGYTAGDLTSVTDPLNQTSKMFVDGAGRTVSTTKADGSSSKVAYDSLNRVTNTVNALGATSSFGYDDNGNVTSMTDARGKVTSWAFDSSDRAKSSTDPLGKVTTWAFDTAGRPTSVTAPSGRTTKLLSYDALDRPAKVTYGPSASVVESTVTPTFDAFDRTATVADTVNGTTTYAYDVRDRITSVTTPKGATTYTYDADSRPATVTTAGQPAVTYTYDASGVLTKVVQGATSVAVGQDSAGRTGTVTLPGGWTQTYGYDASSQISSISYANAGVGKGALSYVYDAAGQRASVGGSFANVTLPAARSGMVYDDANRLTSNAGSALTYDADGNLVNDGTTAYTWNARGQLTNTAKTGLAGVFGYTSSGERSARTVGGTSQGFLSDAGNVSTELTGTNSVDATMLSGATDQWFSRTKAGITDTILTDALGSPVGLGSADGTFTARYAYDPHGVATVTGDTHGADLGFTGRQNDGTGLMYYRARYYNPSLGRFISADPIGKAGGSNLYAYANNTPTTNTDPSGNITPADCAAAAAIGGGISYLTQRLSGRKVQWGTVARDAAVACAMTMGVGLLAELAVGGEAAEGAAAACRLMPNSFTGDTPVLLADGTTKPIRDIKVGDHVKATDPDTGDTESKAVVELIRHDGPHTMVDIGLSDGTTLTATDGHPIFDATTRQFVEAKDLVTGDKLLTAAGDEVAIRTMRTYSEDLTAYNLEIDGIHTYYAGETPVLVHNSCGGAAPVARGAAGVDQVVADIEAAGGRVIGREITLDVNGVRTRPDLLVELPNGQRAFIEVKTGPRARWTQNQKAAFPGVRSGNAVPAGSNALDAGLTPGSPLGPTTIWTIFQ